MKKEKNAAMTLASYILPKIESGEWKRVLFVPTGALMSTVSYNEGASVPLLGFGNVLWKGVKQAIDEKGFLGIFLGGFKASVAGISAALIFGYISSFIFEPKMKK